MGTKMALAFADVFMVNIEKEIHRQSTYKPLVWKRFIDDVFSLWNITKDGVDDFVEQANKLHPTIKVTAEISEKEITSLDTNMCKGQRFHRVSLLDVRTHYKPTETFQYTNFYSWTHEVFIQKVRTNVSKTTFEANIKDLMSHLISRGYPVSLVKNHLGEGQFSNRHLTQKIKPHERKYCRL